MYPTLRPQYRTKTFSEVWGDYESFKEDYSNLIALVSGGVQPLTEANARATFYLLYSRYGNNPIVNFDITQFKVNVMAVIATYGPAWEKRKSIQKSIRDLSEADLLQGAKQIYIHANNPATEPATGDLEELNFINDQSTSNSKKSKMEAYSILSSIIKVDSTDEYLNRFKDCFSRFVGDQCPKLYTIEEE